uniref:6-phosphogluconolactonase n=2 Tax=Araucaria cunninghamii TaxID=56994 RepID=A0A0D6R4W3_ARACU
MAPFILCNTPSYHVGLHYIPSLYAGLSHVTLCHLSNSNTDTPPSCILIKRLGVHRPSHPRLRGIMGAPSPLVNHRVRKPRKISVSMGDSLALKDKGDLRVFENGNDLAASLAEYVAGLSESAIKERGAFSVLLSGGSLINALRKLTETPYLNTIDWGRWHVLWADERVVAKDHPDSNYKLAYDNFLCKVPVVPGRVYSLNDSLSAEAAAEDYDTGLRQLVKTGVVDMSKNGDFPKFDLILLGMGPDGHIASLFPGHPLLNEMEKWITFITDSPKPPPGRITVTLPVINSAANVAVVATGAGKAETLKRVLGGEQHDELLPVQMVSPADGKLTWFTDKEAAAKIIS